MKSQICSADSFLPKRKAIMGPYLVTKAVQFGLTEAGKTLQTFSNTASTAAEDRLVPRVFSK